MSQFKIGQTVWIKPLRKLGIIINECKQPRNHWSIVVRNNNIGPIQIMHLKVTDLKAYKNQCWNCHSDVDSNINSTCEICGWVICSSCGKCKKNGCQSNGLQIHKEPGIKDFIKIDFDLDDFDDIEVVKIVEDIPTELKPKNNYKDDRWHDPGLGKEFWDSIDNMLEK